MGNQSSLPFTTEPESTQTPACEGDRRDNLASVTPTSSPTPALNQSAIVQSAMLDLTSGPGPDYPVVGQVTRRGYGVRGLPGGELRVA